MLINAENLIILLCLSAVKSETPPWRVKQNLKLGKRPKFLTGKMSNANEMPAIKNLRLLK